MDVIVTDLQLKWLTFYILIPKSVEMPHLLEHRWSHWGTEHSAALHTTFLCMDETALNIELWHVKFETL